MACSCGDLLDCLQNLLPDVPTSAEGCSTLLATILAQGSPYFSALTSFPFVLGHEIVGIIVVEGDNRLVGILTKMDLVDHLTHHITAS